MTDLNRLLQSDAVQEIARDLGYDLMSMSEEEKQIFFKILREMIEKGESETLTSLWYEDYEEIPVDIDTFIEDPEYLGNSTDRGRLIYPYWRDVLRKIFAPGAKYYEVAITGGIGLGKTTIAVIGLCYMLHKLLCLRDPQAYYGLTKSSVIGIAFFNVSMDLSFGVAYRKMQNFLLESPWFLRHGEVRGNKDKIYVPGKNISFVVGSKEEHGLGKDIFCLTGDTKIVTSQGIKTLEELEGEKVSVLSFNIDTGRFEWSRPSLIMATGVRDDIYEITLEDGSVFRCTGDHKVLVRKNNGYEYVEARNLREGDDIVSLTPVS